jgi:hypothetical protein
MDRIGVIATVIRRSRSARYRNKLHGGMCLVPYACICTNELGLHLVGIFAVVVNNDALQFR